MKRRTFTRIATAPLFSHVARTALVAEDTDPGVMKLGHQGWSDEASLALLAALGVNHICSALPSPKLDENWSVAGLKRLRERVE